jgi:hypothetical protein
VRERWRKVQAAQAERLRSLPTSDARWATRIDYVVPEAHLDEARAAIHAASLRVRELEAHRRLPVANARACSGPARSCVYRGICIERREELLEQFVERPHRHAEALDDDDETNETTSKAEAA